MCLPVGLPAWEQPAEVSTGLVAHSGDGGVVMVALIRRVARQRLRFAYGWQWVQAVVLLYVGARTLQTNLFEYGIALRVYWLLPIMIGVVWLTGYLLIRWGALQAENDMNLKENCTAFKNTGVEK